MYLQTGFGQLSAPLPEHRLVAVRKYLTPTPFLNFRSNEFETSKGNQYVPVYARRFGCVRRYETILNAGAGDRPNEPTKWNVPLLQDSMTGRFLDKGVST